MSKEVIIKIMSDMSSQGVIDSELAHLAVEHFDEIIAELNKEAQPVLDIYQIIKEEYAKLKDKAFFGQNDFYLENPNI